jgi:TetR/AcrR family fatty acid metabolism transcriptional regulator
MNEHSFNILHWTTWRHSINGKSKINDKYNRILNAAVKVFASQGFFQSTISQIAREAGVADGTIYLYFKNKEDILVNFFSYKTKLAFDGFREVLNRYDNAMDKLLHLVRRHLEVFQDDINMAIVYRAETRQSSRLIENQIREMSKMYLDLVGEIIEQGQEEGTIRKDLYFRLVKQFIMGAVDDVINTWVLAEGKYDLISMADPLVDLLVRGLGNNPPTNGSAV